jgi:hypothetical protein
VGESLSLSLLYISLYYVTFMGERERERGLEKAAGCKAREISEKSSA